MPPLLSIDNISKSYGDFQAVKELSLEIGEGTIYGLLGPNGAGKTTTIRMIMDIIAPDSGSISILGSSDISQTRDRIGYLPEERGLYRKMKIGELLLFFAEIKGVDKPSASQKIEYWLERLELSEWSDKKVEELSRGMQQKLQFITTIINDPHLIILDEPFTGLDPINAELIKQIMLEQKDEGATIIFSTHLMDLVEKFCESICLISQGRKVLDGSLKQVKQHFGRNTISIEYDGDISSLKRFSFVDKFEDYGNYAEIKLADGNGHQDLLNESVKHATIYKFELVEPSLHDIFVETVKKDGGER